MTQEKEKKLKILAAWATRDRKHKIDICEEESGEYSVRFYTGGHRTDVWQNRPTRRDAERKLSVWLDSARMVNKLMYKRIE